MKIAIWTFCLTVLAGILGAIAFAYSGSYQVAADQPSGGFIDWLIHEDAEHSIEQHARSVLVPNDLDTPERIAEGGRHYKAMCTECHMAPGERPSEMRQGLNPTPPRLAQTGSELTPSQIFWVIKHGIKMTAMPAWGKTHEDDKIWAMTAFVKYRLPNMSAAEFDAIKPEEESDEPPYGG